MAVLSWTARTLDSLMRFVVYSGILCHASANYIITHAPKHVSFKQDASPLQESEIPKVIASTYGFGLKDDITWDGLKQGSLFKRPKANVVFNVDSLGTHKLDIDSTNTFKTQSDVSELDTEEVINHIQNIAAEKDPLILDFSIDRSILDIRAKHPGLFRQVPSSYSKLRDAYLAGNFGFLPEELGSLNATHEADLLFLGELHIMQKILEALLENKDSLKTGVPDFYHFKLRGLHILDQKYGPASSQVQDGLELMASYINKMTQQFRDLYNDNVVVQVVTHSPVDHREVQVRKGRSLLEDPTIAPGPAPLDINLAPNYDDMYPVVFNIILWLMVVLTLAIIGISYGIWHMDPGRDSIIYRMTSTRMKKD